MMEPLPRKHRLAIQRLHWLQPRRFDLELLDAEELYDELRRHGYTYDEHMGAWVTPRPARQATSTK